MSRLVIRSIDQSLLVDRSDTPKTNSLTTSNAHPSSADNLYNLTWNPILPYPIRGMSNPANLYLGQHKASTATTYLGKLNMLAQRLGAPNQDYEYLNWSAFDLPQTKAFINNLINPNKTDDRLSNSTINGYLSLIKNIIKQASLMGLVSHNQFQRVSSIKALKVPSGLAGRMATPDEKKAMFEFCYSLANTTKGARDAAMLAALFYAGLRRHEIGLLEMDDVDMTNAIITIKGKGDTVENLEMAPTLMTHLSKWIDEFRGYEKGSLFPRVTKEGTILYNTSITGSGVREILSFISSGVGLCGKDRIRPHDTRRTFGSELLEVTDIKTAADLMRHSNINQTAKYDRRMGERRRNALENLVSH